MLLGVDGGSWGGLDSSGLGWSGRFPLKTECAAMRLARLVMQGKHFPLGGWDFPRLTRWQIHEPEYCAVASNGLLRPERGPIWFAGTTQDEGDELSSGLDPHVETPALAAKTQDAAGVGTRSSRVGYAESMG